MLTSGKAQTHTHSLLFLSAFFSYQSAQFLDPPTPGDGTEYIWTTVIRRLMKH